MITYCIKTLIALIVAYLIGSIPTGYLIVKAKKGIDIRETGSGSTGATNVKRVLGTKWFFIVMFLDALKGYITVVLTQHVFETTLFDINEDTTISIFGLTTAIAAIGAVIGHSKSCFLKFTGGKSVAIGVGALLGLNLYTGLAVALIWGTVTWFSKYVSLGSVVAVSLSPLIMMYFSQNLYFAWFCAISAIYIIIRHWENLKRLFNGTENKVR